MIRFAHLARPARRPPLTALGLPPASGQSLTPIKFTLDFKFQGIHAWYYVARDKGYFKAEGLDVTHRSGRGLGGDHHPHHVGRL